MFASVEPSPELWQAKCTMSSKSSAGRVSGGVSQRLRLPIVQTCTTRPVERDSQSPKQNKGWRDQTSWERMCGGGVVRKARNGDERPRFQASYAWSGTHALTFNEKLFNLVPLLSALPLPVWYTLLLFDSRRYTRIIPHKVTAALKRLAGYSRLHVITARSTRLPLPNLRSRQATSMDIPPLATS